MATVPAMPSAPSRPTAPRPPVPVLAPAEISARLAAPAMTGAPRGEPGLAPAAVLIGLIDRPEGLSILLTRRTHRLSRHAGQIAFPGGRVDPEDPHPVAAALREAEEEVALDPDRVAVLGQLPVYRTGTGFVVTPVVGLVHPPIDLRPNPVEVDEIFEVPLAHALDRANHERCHQPGTREGRLYHAIRFGPRLIWGATAGMLVSLTDHLLPRCPRPGAGDPP